jgi:hypothetical protein|tara:strand:- start:407 stop:688 length:282 start_codon:yes stop_codon:yes gene_type:complete
MQIPLLLFFFIAATLWSSLSIVALRHGGASFVNWSSALLLPATVFAFVRPVPLPYAWAAPPEPLNGYCTAVVALMSAALIAFHFESPRRVRGV